MAEFIKRFAEWFKIKSKLDVSDHKPPFFNEGEVWWCFVGENLGVEISGKGGQFRRPVLVIRKLDQFSFIGIPITKTIRHGSWYQQITFNGKTNTVILAQISHFDYRRLDKIVVILAEEKFNLVKDGLFLLLRNKSPGSGEPGGRGNAKQ